MERRSHLVLEIAVASYDLLIGSTWRRAQTPLALVPKLHTRAGNVQQNVQHFVQHVPRMPDFLTRRHGAWQFVRRVSVEFAKLDRRRVIKHSTRIKIADDRAGRRAVRVAQQLNEQLEIFWKGLAKGHRTEQLHN
ncbi:hypothetical protein [Bradyrhizobium niftali]|uniref:Uncharacterized protein n=1 Tax=Bradyrhizobium niftali TaxID=2560055 RepID=A0A4Y9LZN3_9BRAD|nr:hypothetical protein [Bradyrhizobium niftali]TFV48251.1 hypothetical protein E4K65_12565 [Bradyrhizobium niftali]